MQKRKNLDDSILQIIDDMLDSFLDDSIPQENNQLSIVNHMNTWRKKNNNIFKTGEIFWRKFFEEMESYIINNK